MDFIELSEEIQLDQILKDSGSLPKGALIFKHSTRCALSKMVLNRFQRGWIVPQSEMAVYYLDILKHRSVSNKVVEMFSIEHESPQVLLIKNGSCVYHRSHSNIVPNLIEQEAINA